MKKISLYAASLVAMGLGFTACDQLHNDLRLEPPTSYTLDTPANADQLLIFGTTGSNVDNQLKVVTYNPYNITTEVDFQVQVARSEADFQTWDQLVKDQSDPDGNYDFTDSEGLPYVVTLNQIFTSPSFTLPGALFCGGVNQVYGLEGDDAEEAVVSVAYRVHAWVPNVDYSSIFSNVVVLNKVQTYNPGKEPKKIYMIGKPQGWDINSGDVFLSETEAGSNIFKGSFNIAAGEFIFRFYSELGNWDENSIGSQAEDNPIDIEFTDDVYFGDVVVYNEAEGILGKGSWQYPDWEGGSVEVELNLNDNTISITAHVGEEAPDTPTGNVLYLIGQPQGWDINGDSMWIQETESGSNIYQGTLAIPSGQFQFRFYSALGDWENNSVGAGPSDGNVEITFTDGKYIGEVFVTDTDAGILGKDNWQDNTWEGGYIEFEVNLVDMTITMTQTDGPTLPEPEPADTNIYLRGGMNDWGTGNEWALEQVSDTEWVLENVTIPAGVQFKIADADWSTINLGGPGEEEGVVVTIGAPFELVSGGKNLVLNADFTGKATLSLTDGNYSLLLTPAN